MAKREFGGREQVKEECRQERRWVWVTGLHQDAAFGARMMRKAPVVTLAAVLSLALGIGANTAIVSLMDVVLWRDLPVPSPKQLMFVKWQVPGLFPRDLADGGAGSFGPEGAENVADFFSYASFRTLRQSVSARATLAAFTGFTNPVSVSYAGRPTVAQERGVSGNFFSTLELKPELGRIRSPIATTTTARLPRLLSLTGFGYARSAQIPQWSGAALRSTIARTRSAAVLPRDFYGLVPGDASEIYTPLHQTAFMVEDRGNKLPLDNDRFWCVSILARLAPGVTAAQLQPALDTIFPGTWSRRPKDLSKAPRIHLDEGARGLGALRREFRSPLVVLGGLVMLLLAIACTNIANLLLARANARQKEIAMRVSLGCSRSRLMRQFLTESAIWRHLVGQRVSPSHT